MISNRGIAIYIAVIITAALVLVSFSIISLSIKQVGTSAAARDSQAAFYAADSGVECAIYWDLKKGSKSAFATTSGSIIACNNDVNNPSNTGIAVGGGGINATSTFSLTFLPNPYCVTVNVAKSYSGAIPRTKIESRGYNSCSASNTRRVERAILVNY